MTVTGQFTQILTSTTFLDTTIPSRSAGQTIVAMVLNGNNAGLTRPTGVALDPAGRNTPFTFIPGRTGVNGTDAVETWVLYSARASKTVVRTTWPRNTATDKQVVVFVVTGFVNPQLYLAAGKAVASSSTPSGPTLASPKDLPTFMAARILTTGSGVTGNPNAGNEFTDPAGKITTQLNAACCKITSASGPHTPQWATSAATACANLVILYDAPVTPIRLKKIAIQQRIG